MKEIIIMDIDKNKEVIKNAVFKEYSRSVGKLIRRDYNTIIKIINDGCLYDILEDYYFVYDDLDDAKQQFDTIIEINDISKYPKYSVSKLIKEGIITTYEDDKENSCCRIYLDKRKFGDNNIITVFEKYPYLCSLIIKNQ